MPFVEALLRTLLDLGMPFLFCHLFFLPLFRIVLSLRQAFVFEGDQGFVQVRVEEFDAVVRRADHGGVGSDGNDEFLSGETFFSCIDEEGVG